MTCCLRFATAALVVAALNTPYRAAAKDLHEDRIRPLDPQLQGLLSAGIARSETFRSLVARVQAGDVVVYVRYDNLPRGVHGRLSFLSAAGGVRYVIVAISSELDAPQSIGILGHEFQHAVEIVEQPQIVDAATFAVAYEQATYRRKLLAHNLIGYDTRAAVEAGVRVWKELAVAPAIPVETR